MSTSSFWDDWKAEIPALSENKAILFFLLNLFFPGLGTLFSSCCPCLPRQTFIAVLQFFLVVIIVGWIWSVYWGMIMFKKALPPGQTSIPMTTVSNKVADEPPKSDPVPIANIPVSSSKGAEAPASKLV